MPPPLAHVSEPPPIPPKSMGNWQAAKPGSARRSRLRLTARARDVVAALLLFVPTAVPPAAASAQPPVPAPASPAHASVSRVILAVGAPGEPEFGTNFLQQAQLWQEAAAAHHAVTTVGLDDPPVRDDLDTLRHLLESEPRQGPAPLWLVLIGHGTFDGKEARFNLRGPDLTATNLAQWLQPFTRPVVVINTASSSAPFLPALAGTNRVTVTATRSGYEQNFTRFGLQFARALAEPEADLDSDAQVSLLEAFLRASHGVAEFYRSEGRLATEHALLDDTGDGLGTPGDWFRALRATKRPRDNAPLDGMRAHQFHVRPSADEAALSAEAKARRDALEAQLSALRDRKASTAEDAYYTELERILLELARVYAP